MREPEEIVDHAFACGVDWRSGGSFRRRGGLRGRGFRCRFRRRGCGGFLDNGRRFSNSRRRGEQVEQLGAADGFFRTDGFEDFADGIADGDLFEIEVLWTRGGNEGGAVGAFVEAEAGGGKRAAEALRQAQREAGFFGADVIEQRREGGVDAGGFRVARHAGARHVVDEGCGVVGEEMFFHGGEIGEGFGVLPVDGEIAGNFRSFLFPLLDALRVALHFQAAAVFLEAESREFFAMKLAHPALEVVVVGRSEQDAGHTTDGDDGKVALGRVDLDDFRAVVVGEVSVQDVARGVLQIHPDAAVGAHDEKRSGRLQGRGGELDVVGRRIAQKDAGEVEKAEGFAGVADLFGHGFDRGLGDLEGEAQPGKGIGRWRRRQIATRGAAFVSAGFAPVVRLAIMPARTLSGLTIFERRTVGALLASWFARFAELARGGRGGGILRPGGAEIKCAEIQRRGFVRHGSAPPGGGRFFYSVMMSL